MLKLARNNLCGIEDFHLESRSSQGHAMSWPAQFCPVRSTAECFEQDTRSSSLNSETLHIGHLATLETPTGHSVCALVCAHSLDNSEPQTTYAVERIWHR